MANEKVILDPSKAPIPTRVREESSEKPKAKREKKPKSQPKEGKANTEASKSMFPTEGKVNKYGFVYLNDDILNAWLGHGKGTERKISIDLKEGNFDNQQVVSNSQTALKTLYSMDIWLQM